MFEIKETPITKCLGFCEDNEIFIKRDDLIPFSFGGNKVRIAVEFFRDMQHQGKNCMVGYGNARSNLCRVLANMSYALNGDGSFCYIISPADDDGERIRTNNSIIVESTGAQIHYCEKGNVKATVESVLTECRSLGLNPYYIYGNSDGTGNKVVPMRAYEKAYEEIKEAYDYIFFATGTGMTQAGLIVGKNKLKRAEKIIGISISRKKEQSILAIRNYLEAYYASKQKEKITDEINIVDDYVGEGYGKYTPEIINVIRKMLLHNGICLDPTYTGKAFYGMQEYLKKNGIKGKKILFIHTGGGYTFLRQCRRNYGM